MSVLQRQLQPGARRRVTTIAGNGRTTAPICHINLARGYRGGERQTELLIRELDRCGYRQRLVARAGQPLLERLTDLKTVHLCPVGGRARALFAARGSALIHAHDAKASHVARCALSLWGISYILTRRVDNKPTGLWFIESVYRRAARVVALSGAIRSVLTDAYPELNVDIIPSAGSEMRAKAETVAALRRRFGEKFLIGHVGALVDRHKGQRVLIEAARQLTDLEDLAFLLVGSGEDEADLRQAAGELPVHFAGHVEDVGSYLKAMRLFVFPSRNEGLGSVLIDAMAFALPVIASRVGGIPDLIEDGRNGLLVPPGEPTALAEAIRRLYRDPALCNAMADANRLDAQAYAPAVMADRYQRVYQQVLSARTEVRK